MSLSVPSMLLAVGAVEERPEALDHPGSPRHLTVK